MTDERAPDLESWMTPGYRPPTTPSLGAATVPTPPTAPWPQTAAWPPNGPGTPDWPDNAAAPPFTFDGTADDLPEQDAAIPLMRRRRRLPFGALSIGIALICLVGDIVAISLASTGEYVISTRIAQAVIVLSGVAVLIGVAAAIRRRHRRWAIAGIILGLTVNPLVAVAVLGFFGSL